ncbi:MAG: dTMP kinase [Holosporaceae bacterium]|jgi:dTMP kinase|nr:dTMP kinase [Holosporaceae bacterium]
MSSKGKFITLEGGEGVGKSTQTQLLAERLSNLRQKVKITREPGGGVIGEQVREILKKNSAELDSICEILLLFAARRDHFVNLISPWLEEGYFVICDRFYDSSLIYQGLLKEVAIGDIMELKRMAIGNFEPDLTFVLDVNTNVSLQRVKTRRLLNDEYDQMSRQKYDIVRNGFQKIADIFSFRAVLINAEGSEKAVFSRIWKAFEKRINIAPVEEEKIV